MKKEQINIRDPFVVFENGVYYLYGTRANNFGRKTGGFDVYTSTDLENWSEPTACFDSEKYGLNKNANWAPEVHKYNGKYYMFATFVQENGLRGTYSLCSNSLYGPFVPNSNGALTPNEWECLDGTLYINKKGEPYIVFCHEHTQIIDGTVCYAKLNANLSAIDGEVVTLFAGSECKWINCDNEGHFITDGPFMYRSKNDELFMIWSSFVNGKYAELLVKFKGGEIGMEFEHLTPLLDNDGGHGMIFDNNETKFFTYHYPNRLGYEHPEFALFEDYGNELKIKKP